MDVLKNEGYLQYDRISRYSVVPIYYNTLRDNYVSGSSTYLNNTTNYTVYKVKYKDTYDKIALKFYNNPSYFWIICSFNRIQDCFKDPVPGTNLKIPNFSELGFNI